MAVPRRHDLWRRVGIPRETAHPHRARVPRVRPEPRQHNDGEPFGRLSRPRRRGPAATSAREGVGCSVRRATVQGDDITRNARAR